MRIHRLEIQRFRGIRELSWKPQHPFVCLLGPGDSTKTTILDAVELVLSPKWSIQFSDNDFYDADTSQPFIIRATIGELPDELLSDAKFGHDTRGWSPDGELHDEPAEDDGLVLTLQLRVEANLEPVWTVVNDRLPDGKPIRAQDRERIGSARVGAYVDRHLSWSRGTVLAKLTDTPEGISGVLAAAGRAARQAINPANLPEMGTAATAAETLAAVLGVAPKIGFQPHLDVQAASLGVGALALHDGPIPARVAGLGSARLLAMALQLEAAKDGGLTLIDEVEHALEPHRLRRLLRRLQLNTGPTFVTTHSALVLEELPAERLAVVRWTAGETRVLPVPADLQAVVRSCSEALLARKVIVCEGPTELGFLRAFDDWWHQNGESFGLRGVALADGGGESAPARAVGICSLGYATALLADSDKPLTPTPAEMTVAGITVFQWDGGVATEERVVGDLPWAGVVEAVQYAIANAAERGEKDSVRDAVAGRIPIPATDLPDDPVQWVGVAADAALRSAIGKAAKKKGWFKRAGLAEDLGRIVIKHWDAMAGTDLRTKIEAVRLWALQDGQG